MSQTGVNKLALNLIWASTSNPLDEEESSENKSPPWRGASY